MEKKDNSEGKGIVQNRYGDIMEEYCPVLKNCALFRGIEDTQLVPLMQCMNVRMKQYREDEYVFLNGDEINDIGVVLEGTIEIVKESLAGNKNIVAILGQADMFAEGIVCTRARISPVSVRVREETKLILIPYERVIRSCGNSCAFHIRLIQNMMVVLGEKNVVLNRKMELLILKGMREKLASYLLNEAVRSGETVFQIGLNRNDLAEYLNVSRTSMCRELARMKEEGLIDFYGNSFKLTDKQRLMESLRGND